MVTIPLTNTPVSKIPIVMPWDRLFCPSRLSPCIPGGPLFLAYPACGQYCFPHLPPSYFLCHKDLIYFLYAPPLWPHSPCLFFQQSSKGKAGTARRPRRPPILDPTPIIDTVHGFPGPCHPSLWALDHKCANGGNVIYFTGINELPRGSDNNTNTRFKI